MSVGVINELMRDAIQQVISMILPILSVALVVGLLIGIFQAVTSIQEQTLTFLPKLLFILIIIGLFGGVLFGGLGEYTIALFRRIPDFAR